MNNDIRVEKTSMLNDNEDSIDQATYSIVNKNQADIDEDDNLTSLSQMDVSLNHFDAQAQVNDGQLEQVVRYGVFSSLLTKDTNVIQTDKDSQTIEPEVDMDSWDGDRNYNNYSRQSNGNSYNNNDGSYQRSRRSNGFSDGGAGGGSGNADGNGSNPNRNNNNGRR